MRCIGVAKQGTIPCDAHIFIELVLNNQLIELIQSAMDAVVCIDATQNITLFNAAAELMFGYREQQMLGASLNTLLPERFRAAHAHHVAAFGKTGASSRRMGQQLVLFGLRASGEEFPIEASISRALIKGEHSYGVILRDVTERLRAEQALQAAKDELQQLSHASIQALENEKTRIAREIHDELGQKLTALKMDLHQLNSMQASLTPKQFEAMQRMRSLIDETVANSRAIAANLRPLMLDDLGLGAALEWHVQQFTRRFHVKCELQLDPYVDELPKEIASHVFRIVQEGLNNIAKHANAQNASIEIKVTADADANADAVTITMSDDGVGMPDSNRSDQPKSKNPPHLSVARFGLLGIRERACSQAGTMFIGKSTSGGVTLQVRLPFQKSKSSDQGLTQKHEGST
jgi:PAS domain S-box-containing protein